ncbi:MAG: SurA N-terminal domain-containing protein [Paracoccaceae bacterium]
MAKKNSAQNILMWGLMALLVAGLGGFGIDNFLSQRVTAIGAVGDRQITTQAYANALQAEMNAIGQQIGQPLTLAQAQAFGIDRQVRAQLVQQAALDNETDRVGVSVGDENVFRLIRAIRAFQGAGGTFDPEAYRFALQNVGQTPAEFEAQVRAESARGILQSATAAGVETPAILRESLVDYYAGRHSFDIFTLTEADLATQVAEPTPEQVEQYYNGHIAEFTAPEMRAITYVWLTPEMIRDSVEVDEALVRELYDERLDTYVIPERRLVERLVYPSQAEAEAAKARLDAGSVSFEELVSERGLSLEDADMGDVSESQLGAAGATIFGLTDSGVVVGPLDSPFGPALYRMNAILNAQETPFEDARAELRDELAADRARRTIADLQDGFDDLLAGGATLEQLADETQMQLGQIDWTADAGDGIAGYAEFRAAAASTGMDDFPELASLSDGGLFALRVDAITPPTPRPLDDVREAATLGARAAIVDAALAVLATDLSATLVEQGTEAFGEAQGRSAESFEGISRLDSVTEVPGAMLETIFASDTGAPVVHVVDQTARIALVRSVEPADRGDEQTARLIDAIERQVGSTLGQDVFAYFAQALQTEAGISLNQAAIDAVHANFR